MNSKLTALNAVCFCACLVCATAVSSGLEAQTRPAETPATSTVAKDIPGVIKGGTKIEVVIATVPGHGAPGATGQGTEGPISLSDGTLAFCETNLGRVAKVDQNGHESVLIDESQAHAPNGLSWDSKGRLIGATTAAGHTGVAAIYPNGSEAVLADKFENKAFVRPNDLIVAKNGGIYFTDPANLPNPALPPAVSATALPWTQKAGFTLQPAVPCKSSAHRGSC